MREFCSGFGKYFQESFKINHERFKQIKIGVNIRISDKIIEVLQE